MWAEKGVKERKGVREKLSETEKRETKTGGEWGELTPHNPLFFIFLNRTLNIIITL